MIRRSFLYTSLSCLFFAVALPVFAQEDPDKQEQEQQEQSGKKMSKAMERAKFHPTKVKGMSATERMRGWEQRKKLIADSAFGGITWKNVGPEIQSGRVNDIAAPADDPSKLYVAYATGGLYRTEDDGITWTSLFDQESSFGIGAIAVSKDGKTIWVGTGEANSQRTSYAGTGIFKSTDEGKTWQNMGLLESHHISKVVIDPKNPNIVYAAALGHLYSQNEERGVYKTTDGGKTWDLILKVDEFTGCGDIVIDPKNPNVLVAAMYDRDRRAWNFRESGPGSAAYRTEDGGKTWKKISTLPMGESMGRTCFTICESKPNVLYAMVENPGDDPEWSTQDERIPGGRLTPRRFLLLTEETIQDVDKGQLRTFLNANAPEGTTVDSVLSQIKDGKMTIQSLKALIEKRMPELFKGDAGDQCYRSDDNGKTWKKTPDGSFGTIGGYYYNKIFVNPKDPDEVYACGLPVLHSKDGGKSWTSVATRAHVDYHAVWFDAKDPKKTWFGNDGGLYLSHDEGKTVRHLNNLSVGQTTTIAVDNRSPYNIYVGLQDNGTMKGPSTYTPGRTDLNAWTAIGGGDGSWVTVDPREDLDLVYTASQFGAHSARQGTPRNGWSARANAGRGEAPLRYNWISPLVLSPFHPDIVYLGAQKLFRSFDKGRGYKAISPDLTKDRPNGDVPYSTIKDISESPFRFGLIYVGCDDGSVKMTPDGGLHWTDIATPQPDKWVSRIVASKYDEKTVYCAQNGYREDDFTPYLWKSTDYGKTWRSITGNLPAECINVVREDPFNRNMLYAGTDMGVYVTFNGGLIWEALAGGLPSAPVHDLVIQPNAKDLVIATHSRGAWILPLAKVYGLTDEVRNTDLTVFDVDDMTKSSTWGLDPNRPRYDVSPPRNPTVEVPIFTKAPGTGTIRLLDKAGKVVLEKPFTAIRGYNTLSFGLETVPGKPGTVDVTKRQVKNAKEALADPRETERPQYLAPGEYKLEVSIGTAKVTKDWKLDK